MIEETSTMIPIYYMRVPTEETHQNGERGLMNRMSMASIRLRSRLAIREPSTGDRFNGLLASGIFFQKSDSRYFRNDIKKLSWPLLPSRKRSLGDKRRMTSCHYDMKSCKRVALIIVNSVKLSNF